MKILIGHVSPETAYQVDDYPYGFRLRCKVRYWLDYNKRHGVRLVSQTSDPKHGHRWNKPKYSTYSRFGGCMYLDEQDHVQWSGLSEYSTGAEATAWLATYGAGNPEPMRELTARWTAAKVAYDGNRTKSDPLDVGLAEAHQAFVKPL